MQSPPNMPQFGQAPIIGQQKQQMQAQVQAVIRQVSLGIYSQLASTHLGTLDKHESLNQDQLRKLAKDSQVAAQCYFEGIGVIQPRAEEQEEKE